VAQGPPHGRVTGPLFRPEPTAMHETPTFRNRELPQRRQISSGVRPAWDA
jgi:hypothetical protein